MMLENISNRQLEIINTAIKLIGNGGIQELTTKNLANNIGISEAALYRHFKSKTEILKALLNFLKTTRLERLNRIEKQKKTSLEKIKLIIEEQFQSFTAQPEMVVVLLSEGMYQNEKELTEIVFSIMQESEAILQKIISDGQQTSEITSAVSSHQLAFIIMGSMRFSVIQWYLSGFSINLNNQGKLLFGSLSSLLSNK